MQIVAIVVWLLADRSDKMLQEHVVERVCDAEAKMSDLSHLARDLAFLPQFASVELLCVHCKAPSYIEPNLLLQHIKPKIKT